MIMRLNTKKIKEKYRTSKSLPHDLLYWPPFFCMEPKRCFSYHRKPFCTSVSFKQSNGYIIIRDSKFCIIYFLLFSFFYQKQSMDRLYWAGTVLLLKFSDLLLENQHFIYLILTQCDYSPLGLGLTSTTSAFCIKKSRSTTMQMNFIIYEKKNVGP